MSIRLNGVINRLLNPVSPPFPFGVLCILFCIWFFVSRSFPACPLTNFKPLTCLAHVLSLRLSPIVAGFSAGQSERGSVPPKAWRDRSHRTADADAPVRHGRPRAPVFAGGKKTERGTDAARREAAQGMSTEERSTPEGGAKRRRAKGVAAEL